MSDNPSATANPLVALSRLGQSPWYDFITRDLVRSGELARLIQPSVVPVADKPKSAHPSPRSERRGEMLAA